MCVHVYPWCMLCVDADWQRWSLRGKSMCWPMSLTVISALLLHRALIDSYFHTGSPHSLGNWLVWSRVVSWHCFDCCTRDWPEPDRLFAEQLNHNWHSEECIVYETLAAILKDTTSVWESLRPRAHLTHDLTIDLPTYDTSLSEKMVKQKGYSCFYCF